MKSDRGNPKLEAEATLSKIVDDFERLEVAISSVLESLQAQGRTDDIVALQRAREAARTGAALAKRSVKSE